MMARSLPSLAFHVVIFISSLLCLSTCSVSGMGEEDTHHTFSVRSLLPSTNCFDDSKGTTNQTGLRVYHRHGPCSPLTHSEKATSANDILAQDQSRVNYLHRRTTSSISKNPINSPSTSPIDNEEYSKSASLPARSGQSLGSGNYVVTVGFGTPKRDMSLVFDTGSDLTWIQCQPCARYCYSQNDPIFDPSASTSYANVTCNSPDCSLVSSATGRAPGCSTTSTCLYAISYGDNSYSVGFFVRDTITLTPSDVFPGFRFGCGQKNRGLFGQVSGLLGLGREKISLISQTAQTYGGVFSYCLPSTSSSQPGHLTLGRSARPQPNVQYTPMLTDSSASNFYYLDLIAISVKGTQLSIPPSVFSVAGTLIDSGTVITRLPPAAYSALRTAFRNEMTAYPTAPALSILDTCYDLSKYDTVTVPKVALMFKGGAVLNVVVTGILYAGSASQVCLAFAGNSDASDVGILGNVQQTTYEVVYDTSRSLIGFAPGGCS
ncbi:Protein ASPARTIC PROTEASE IN GUARD CELL 2 [Acorus calamus]|uniref:Protein ASPARTIC PROTEASE IN GUARD CELL 2 n=1 Tax=Acorus calamus TaxID=4465 RepID=A0AAV9D5T8_ACOCL|nr:Protein ASPARTIC PROTEASE IN GUARD CELL 2 [Acorus calamus]